jgi:hypothetical protein
LCCALRIPNFNSVDLNPNYGMQIGSRQFVRTESQSETFTTAPPPDHRRSSLSYAVCELHLRQTIHGSLERPLHDLIGRDLSKPRLSRLGSLLFLLFLAAEPVGFPQEATNTPKDSANPAQIHFR